MVGCGCRDFDSSTFGSELQKKGFCMQRLDLNHMTAYVMVLGSDYVFDDRDKTIPEQSGLVTC
eukprot:scaffold3305_cov122-Skeletonema_menzelii.AAC.4